MFRPIRYRTYADNSMFVGMNGRKTILVVDDEPKIVHLVRAYLEKAGFHVAEALDGTTALDSFRISFPDLIVLDLMLPGIDGIELTRLIRKESEVPIIMLTARAEEVDRLIGLELGADDYVVKPFSPRELVARVRAVLRRAGYRSPVPPTAKIFRTGGLSVDTERRRVTIDDAPVVLTAFQFDLLALLVSYPGKVFNRPELLDTTQGESLETYARTIDAHIKNLRKALGENARAPRFIHTVHGVGYRFNDAAE